MEVVGSSLAWWLVCCGDCLSDGAAYILSEQICPTQSCFEASTATTEIKCNWKPGVLMLYARSFYPQVSMQYDMYLMRKWGWLLWIWIETWNHFYLKEIIMVTLSLGPWRTCQLGPGATDFHMSTVQSGEGQRRLGRRNVDQAHFVISNTQRTFGHWKTSLSIISGHLYLWFFLWPVWQLVRRLSTKLSTHWWLSWQ